MKCLNGLWVLQIRESSDKCWNMDTSRVFQTRAVARVWAKIYREYGYQTRIRLYNATVKC